MTRAVDPGLTNLRPSLFPDGTVIWTVREQCHFSRIAKAMGRSALASADLGRHNGLPATIIVV